MIPGRTFELSPRAERDFDRLDDRSRRRVVEALERWVAEPPRGDVQKLRGTTDEWRLRVGDLRIRFTEERPTRVIRVLRILPRGAAYRS